MSLKMSTFTWMIIEGGSRGGTSGKPEELSVGKTDYLKLTLRWSLHGHRLGYCGDQWPRITR
jgi:hypothetical protein